MSSNEVPISRRTMVTRLGAGVTGAAFMGAAPTESQASSGEATAPFTDPTTKYPEPPYPGQSHPWSKGDSGQRRRSWTDLDPRSRCQVELRRIT